MKITIYCWSTKAGTSAVFLPSDHAELPNTSASQDNTGNVEGAPIISSAARVPRMISFGREVLPHSYLADTGPD
jgi:hypothetical protein